MSASHELLRLGRSWPIKGDSVLGHAPGRGAVSQAYAMLIPAARSVLEQLYFEALQLDGSNTILSAKIVDWCQRTHDYLVHVSRNEPTMISQWQDLLLPYFMKGDFLRRCREQPRGYAGDFRTIQMMYESRPLIYEEWPSASDTFGRAVDGWAMNQPCPRAVRNRRRLVRDLIMKTRKEAGPAMHVVSLGCGPAAEVFDVVNLCDARFTLLDIDAEAVDFVNEKIRANHLEHRITVRRENVIKMALRNDIQFTEPPSIVYSLGLIDYFSDELVIRMLDYLYESLGPGGVTYLGNFKPGHPNVALFEHALNWPLVLRSENELLALINRSKFAKCRTSLGMEKEGIQLFVECHKPS